MQTPQVKRAVADKKVTYGSVRLAFLRALMATLRNEELNDPLELDMVLAAHPVDLDRMAEAIRSEFGSDANVHTQIMETPEDDEVEEPEEERRAMDSAAASSSEPVLAESGTSAYTAADSAMTAASSQPAEVDVVSLPFQPGDREPLDANGRPCAHHRRDVPPLIWTHTKIAKKLHVPSGQTHDNALNVLKAFISERSVLRNGLDALEENHFNGFVTSS